MQKTSAQSAPYATRVPVLRDTITLEIYRALGMRRDRWPRRMIGRLLRPVTTRFAGIAARYVYESASLGVAESARRTMPDFCMRASSRGARNIPASGPVLLAINHPGALDSLALMSCMPRSDVKILVSDSAFMREFAAGSPFFIFVDFKTVGGMSALREAIDHLRSGGLVSLYAHGEVEPDPELDAAGALAALPEWSRSIEIMLRKEPLTRLVLGVQSGAVMHRFLASPLTWLRRRSFEKQKLAEFIQVISTLAAPKRVNVQMHLSFSRALSLTGLEQEGVMPGVVRQATALMTDHVRHVMRKRPA